MRRAGCPFGVVVGVGQLREGCELFVGDLTGVRRGSHRRQILQPARRLDRLAQGARRHAVGRRGGGLVDVATLVEHRHHRELLHVEAALFAHQLGARRERSHAVGRHRSSSIRTR